MVYNLVAPVNHAVNHVAPSLNCYLFDSVLMFFMNWGDPHSYADIHSNVSTFSS